MEFKYMVKINDNVAHWSRGLRILYAESVFVFVESINKPLYFKEMFQWLHYVLVKRYMSDLIENIY